MKTHPEIVHFSIRVCCLHIERKLKRCQRKKEKQLKAIWGYLSPRIEYLKDIPKNIFDKGISAISYTEEFKEEFDKNPKDTLKHIIDKLNSELNSILHEYDLIKLAPDFDKSTLNPNLEESKIWFDEMAEQLYNSKLEVEKKT